MENKGPVLANQYLMRSDIVARTVLNGRHPEDSMSCKILKSPDVAVFLGATAVIGVAIGFLEGALRLGEITSEKFYGKR